MTKFKFLAVFLMMAVCQLSFGAGIAVRTDSKLTDLQDPSGTGDQIMRNFLGMSNCIPYGATYNTTQCGSPAYLLHVISGHQYLMFNLQGTDTVGANGIVLWAVDWQNQCGNDNLFTPIQGDWGTFTPNTNIVCVIGLSSSLAEKINTIVCDLTGPGASNFFGTFYGQFTGNHYGTLVADASQVTGINAGNATNFPNLSPFSQFGQVQANIQAGARPVRFGFMGDSLTEPTGNSNAPAIYTMAKAQMDILKGKYGDAGREMRGMDTSVNASFYSRTEGQNYFGDVATLRQGDGSGVQAVQGTGFAPSCLVNSVGFYYQAWTNGGNMTVTTSNHIDGLISYTVGCKSFSTNVMRTNFNVALTSDNAIRWSAPGAGTNVIIGPVFIRTNGPGIIDWYYAKANTDIASDMWRIGTNQLFQIITNGQNDAMEWASLHFNVNGQGAALSPQMQMMAKSSSNTIVSYLDVMPIGSAGHDFGFGAGWCYSNNWAYIPVFTLFPSFSTNLSNLLMYDASSIHNTWTGAVAGAQCALRLKGLDNLAPAPYRVSGVQIVMTNLIIGQLYTNSNPGPIRVVVNYFASQGTFGGGNFWALNAECAGVTTNIYQQGITTSVSSVSDEGTAEISVPAGRTYIFRDKSVGGSNSVGLNAGGPAQITIY